MRLTIKIFFCFTFLLCTFALFAQTIPERPNPPRLVNDLTNTLTPDQQQALENKLVAFDDSTSTQIAVVIIPTLNGAGISKYNLDLGREWGVGTVKNNGVVLLMVKDDRKLDITAGYGLEGSLTDGTSQLIIDDIIVPNFKGNDYYRGLDQGTDAIIQAVNGTFNTPRQKNSGKGGGGMSMWLIIIFIIIFLISRRGGGGGKGTYMSRRGGTGIADAILWSTLLGGGRGGGGGGGFGGGFGGGSSGGGFGGFGGGSFGGGGASGSW